MLGATDSIDVTILENDQTQYGILGVTFTFSNNIGAGCLTVDFSHSGTN